MDRRVKAASLSILSNTTLLTLKLIIGIISGSISIISAAADSLNDLAASIIAFFSVRAATRPPDTEHPYGHGKIENISSAIQAFLIFTAAIYIIYEAVQKILHPKPIETLGLGLAVMAFTALLDLFVSRYLLKVAEETNSAAIRADAYHLTTDVWTAVSVFIGLLIVRLTGMLIFDPIIALGIAIMILHVAYVLTIESAHTLIDMRLPLNEVSELKQMIMNTAGVTGYHKMRTRRSGSFREIDYHLIVPAAMPVKKAHRIAQQIENKMMDRFPQTNIVTHIEPDTPDIINEPDTELRLRVGIQHRHHSNFQRANKRR